MRRHLPAVPGQRATIDLSHLTPEQALLAFELLDELASAIWAAHDSALSNLAAQEALVEAAQDDADAAALDTELVPDDLF